MDPDAEKAAARATSAASDTHMGANQRSPARPSPAVPSALSTALPVFPTTTTTPPAINKCKQPCQPAAVKRKQAGQQHKRGQRQESRGQRVRERTRERARWGTRACRPERRKRRRRRGPRRAGRRCGWGRRWWRPQRRRQTPRYNGPQRHTWADKDDPGERAGASEEPYRGAALGGLAHGPRRRRGSPHRQGATWPT